MRVLIAQREDDSRQRLSLMAQSLGHEVLTASGGNEVRRNFEDTLDVEVVVSDWELSRAVREESNGKRVLLLITGPEDGEQPAKSLEAGADGYLVEPVSVSTLETYLGNAESNGNNALNGPETRPENRTETYDTSYKETRTTPLRRGRLRDVLLEQGKVTEDQLQQADVNQGTSDIGEALVSTGALSEEDVAQAHASRLGLQYLELYEKDVDRDVLELFPEKVLRRHGALPLGIERGSIVVAVSDPSNLHALDDLKMISGYQITPVVTTDTEIDKVQNRFFASGESLSNLLDEAAGDEDEEESGDLDLGAEANPEDRPVIRLVSSILQQAVSDGASDIHVEPRAGSVTVRIRVDGVLREVMSIPPRLQGGVIARLKIIGNLDIAERRIPQDGRFSVKLSSKKVDFRVASLPTVHGEKIVLRLLDTASVETDLRKLGFSPEVFEAYEDIFKRPYGAILVTGPTGSGKSTTLYATLKELNSEEKNIITVEDPVELRVAGVNQMQVNSRAGLTFASGLRSILRSDPDVLMIGEIRDEETAKISVEAALTGHLVLATLHTNDAPGALTRLTEMGVEPFLTSSAVDCVIAQRLARRLCPRCKRPAEFERSVLEEMGFPFDEIGGASELYEAVGCDRCGGTGYSGRLGIYEMMVVNEEIRDLILRRASVAELSQAAETAGMVRLREDGMIKAAQGITTLEEVLRTVL